MTLEEIKATLQTTQYDFLRNDARLGENIILLTLGGSHAYGLNKTSSDLDIRGISLNSKPEILLGQDFESFVNTTTDTVIYSFNKMIRLLASNNPTIIEMLGCKPEHYLYLSPIGKELLENRKIFLSKHCIDSFAGYARSQYHRMRNKSARFVMQTSENPASYDKLGKYMAHLLRSYMMGIDILENGEIITYRKDEHDLLMNIRNGAYLDKDGQPTAKFYELFDEYEKQFEYAKVHTNLPDDPDYDQIDAFHMSVNERIVCRDIFLDKSKYGASHDQHVCDEQADDYEIER